MTLAQFFAENPEVVQVQLGQVRGSSPREAGAQMFVAPAALHATIGGGQLEYMAVDKARAMLRSGSKSARMDVPLGPEIGQCCGGRVGLDLRLMTGADRAAAEAAVVAREAAQPHVYILGAGHVGRALARVFQFLPVRCVLIDSRPAELALVDADVERCLSTMAEAVIRHAPAGSAFVVLTHDHALDFLLTSEALDRADAAYVGMIGSATKRVKFERFYGSLAPSNSSARLICPIGAARSADKRPEVIAALVAAEIITALTHTETQVTNGPRISPEESGVGN